jgi:16S rRNA (cytosine967-C5)-methyltransferase
VGGRGGVSLASRHVRLGEAGPISELPGFREGGWWVQDLAASVPARLILPSAVEVLDLCAAPGGKTMQLAAAGHRLTSLDHSEARLERLAENLERTGLQARLIAADALEWQPDRGFDAILLDAPCSATGTFRRHPEVLYRARPDVIQESADLQRRLLARAASFLGPGGVLVYSVCSLEPEEGENIISDFLKGSSSFQLDRPREGELPPFAKAHQLGWLRILPGVLEEEGGADGFFVARLVRTAT